MKLKSGIKTGDRYKSGRPPRTRPASQYRLTPFRRSSDGLVQEFRDAVRKRPSDTSWLIRYGWLARSMGLTYEEALPVVKRHIRRLRGNTRLAWIDKGLREGYNLTGLSQ
jgi:hypothetical protein